MSTFDDQFADRVREVFDGYHEPVDEASLGRMHAALAARGMGVSASSVGVAGVASDRPPVVRTRSSRRFGTIALAVAAVAIAVGAFWAANQGGTDAGGPVVAVEDRPLAAEPREEAVREDGPDAEATTEAAGTVAPLGETVSVGPSAEPRPPSAGAPASVDRRSGLGRVERRPDVAERSAPNASGGSPGQQETTPASPQTALRPDPANGRPEASALAPIAALPPVRASVFTPRTGAGPVPDMYVRPAQVGRSDAGVRLRVVAGSAAGFASGQAVEGIGVTTGFVAEVPVGRGVSLSGGALAAYDQYAVERGRSNADVYSPPNPAGFADQAEVLTRTARTTVAVEIPLDVSLALARTRRARLGVSVGVTSAVVLSEQVDREGRRYLSAPEGGREDLFTSVGFDETETAPAGRVDLARQLNLGVTLAPRGSGRPLSLEWFARLPLRTVTEGDVPLTVLGLRLRYDV